MRKGGKFGNDDDEEEEEGANWQDSYSDLVTDLLAIFVVLFSFAMMQQSYSNAANSAANDSFIVMEGQGSSPLTGSDGVLDGQDSLFAEQSSIISGDGQAQGQSGEEQQANSAQSADTGQNTDTAQGADANQNAAASQGENADQNANAQGANSQGADANQGINGNQNANAQGANGSQNANQGINGNQNANAQGANGSQNANQGMNGKNGNQSANAQGADADQGANENVEDFLDSTDLYVGSSEYEDQISVSRQGSNEVLLRINGSILFDLGKAKVSPNAESTLRKVGDILTANKDSISMVRVEGHTDNIPINSLEFESNWELSTFRAVNVVKWLLKNSTLSEELFSAVGYGEYHPISDNDSSEGRARNRRVDFIIELKSDGTQ